MLVDFKFKSCFRVSIIYLFYFFILPFLLTPLFIVYFFIIRLFLSSSFIPFTPIYSFLPPLIIHFYSSLLPCLFLSYSLIPFLLPCLFILLLFIPYSWIVHWFNIFAYPLLNNTRLDIKEWNRWYKSYKSLTNKFNYLMCGSIKEEMKK